MGKKIRPQKRIDPVSDKCMNNEIERTNDETENCQNMQNKKSFSDLHVYLWEQNHIDTWHLKQMCQQPGAGRTTLVSEYANQKKSSGNKWTVPHHTMDTNPMSFKLFLFLTLTTNFFSWLLQCLGAEHMRLWNTVHDLCCIIKRNHLLKRTLCAKDQTNESIYWMKS